LGKEEEGGGGWGARPRFRLVLFEGLGGHLVDTGAALDTLEREHEQTEINRERDRERERE
jgi:hypothetical protein